MTNLIYNEVDITKSVNIKKCILHDYAGNCADDADISFPDGDKIWSKWNPKRGDNIVIKSDNYSTGLMYVDSLVKSAGLFNIRAISTPLSAKKPKTRIWRNVKLSEIIADLAKNNSLTVQTLGITDYTYIVVSQIEQSDIGFLNSLCIREGYCCKITDGKLIVFSESYMENQVSAININPEDLNPDYEFSFSDDILQSFTVRYYSQDHGLITYTASDRNITGGTSRKVELISNVGEAERWSKGYLRYKNKYMSTAWLPMKYIADVAASSIVNINGFGNFDAKYYIDKISHDTVNNRSYLSARQTIESY